MPRDIVHPHGLKSARAHMKVTKAVLTAAGFQSRKYLGSSKCSPAVGAATAPRIGHRQFDSVRDPRSPAPDRCKAAAAWRHAPRNKAAPRDENCSRNRSPSLPNIVAWHRRQFTVASGFQALAGSRMHQSGAGIERPFQQNLDASAAVLDPENPGRHHARVVENQKILSGRASLANREIQRSRQRAGEPVQHQ
jgi:hypothetical protein